MAYVVIVCSRCRLARGAAETARTASCPNCGRRLRVSELKKYYRSESLDQTREAIGQLNARLKGGLDIYLEDVAGSVSGAQPPGQKNAHVDSEEAGALKEDRRIRQMGKAVPQNKLDRAIVMCLMGRGRMTSDEILQIIGVKCTADQLEKRLEALRRSGMIYEPAAGRYELVP